MFEGSIAYETLCEKELPGLASTCPAYWKQGARIIVRDLDARKWFDKPLQDELIFEHPTIKDDYILRSHTYATLLSRGRMLIQGRDNGMFRVIDIRKAANLLPGEAPNVPAKRWNAARSEP